METKVIGYDDSNTCVRIPMLSRSVDDAKVSEILGKKCGHVSVYFRRGTSFVVIFDTPEAAKAAVTLSGTDFLNEITSSKYSVEYADARDRGSSFSNKKSAVRGKSPNKQSDVNVSAPATTMTAVVATSSPPVVVSSLLFYNVPKTMFSPDVKLLLSKDVAVDVDDSCISYTSVKKGTACDKIYVITTKQPTISLLYNTCTNKITSTEEDNVWRHMTVELVKNEVDMSAGELAIVNAVRELNNSTVLCDITLTINDAKQLSVLIATCARNTMNIELSSESLPCNVHITKAERRASLSANAAVFIPKSTTENQNIATSPSTSFTTYRFDVKESSVTHSNSSSSSGRSRSSLGHLLGCLVPVREPRGPAGDGSVGFVGGRGKADLSTPPPIQNVITLKSLVVNTSPNDNNIKSSRHRTHSHSHSHKNK